MQFNIRDFQWTREPAAFAVSGNQVEIVTKPHTDLWQRTYYHFRNDNAPVFQMETEEKFFSFVVKTSFEESHHRFDQELICKGWILPPNTYDCGSFVVNGKAVIGKELKSPNNR